MASRMVSIYFPSLTADWMTRRKPELKDIPFASALTERGRRIIKSVNTLARDKGVFEEMVVADCRALVPELHLVDYDPEQPKRLLNALAEWCIRYSPSVAVTLPDGLLIDSSGCDHLWGGEQSYLEDIERRFSLFGYQVKTAMADTIGAAWALSRFGKRCTVVEPDKQAKAIFELPAVALRLETSSIEKLNKLGLVHIGSFMEMPRTALRRRFGQSLLTRLDQALGAEMEFLEPVRPVAPYQERLPSLEPIRTAPGIEIALQELIAVLCQRLKQESKGLRKCILRCYRMDGNIQVIEISTSRPSRNTTHLFKLFETRIPQIEPDLGIELFVLEAPVVEDLQNEQDALWTVARAGESAVAELLDRLAGKIGARAIHRYLPDEHYWPEHAYKEAGSLSEPASTSWRMDLPRPLHVLQVPEQIEVSVPIPDYPPLLFRYKNTLHTVEKADGPERIEQEWWLQSGLYRDYYCVEDELGRRYWLFRSGDYASDDVKWFIHGFFA